MAKTTEEILGAIFCPDYLFTEAMLKAACPQETTNNNE